MKKTEDQTQQQAKKKAVSFHPELVDDSKDPKKQNNIDSKKQPQPEPETIQLSTESVDLDKEEDREDREAEEKLEKVLNEEKVTLDESVDEGISKKSKGKNEASESSSSKSQNQKKGIAHEATLSRMETRNIEKQVKQYESMHANKSIRDKDILQMTVFAKQLKTQFFPDLAIRIYNILIENKEMPEYYEGRAECYRSQYMFIEATDDLQMAANLVPHAKGSISSEKYYDRVLKIFQQFGLNFMQNSQ